MGKFKAQNRNGDYCSPEMKFHQIRFYVFTLAEYWKAYLAEQQMKRSLQSSFFAFPEPTAAPKPSLSASSPDVGGKKKMPPTPKGEPSRAATPTYANVSSLTYSEVIFTADNSSTTEGYEEEDEPEKVQLRKSQPEPRGFPSKPDPQQQQIQLRKSQPVVKPKPVAKAESSPQLKKSPSPVKASPKKKKKGEKETNAPAGKADKLGVYVLDGKQKRIYPIFKKLIILDEKLKTQNSIAEREPNDFVHTCLPPTQKSSNIFSIQLCYALIYRRPAMAHGGPIKFKVIVDGQYLEHHPLANGHYLFFGFPPGEHTFELQLPGSVAIARTNKSFQTDSIQPGELQLIEVKIGGHILPETQITHYPKFNFYDCIWGQDEEK